MTDPKRCPTCGSDDPKVRGTMEWGVDRIERDCDDAFHDTPASEPVIDVDAALARRKAERASESTCPTCGGPKDEPLVITEGDLRVRCVDWFHPCNPKDDTSASEPTPSEDIPDVWVCCNCRTILPVATTEAPFDCYECHSVLIQYMTRAESDARVAEEREANHNMLIEMAEGERHREEMALRTAAATIRARGKRLGRDMTESTDWNIE